ncbi:hypothetical protein [uncultured Lacinutrix sp.]|uniref:hypothetical protein n=1 Tax=uncultured Lacinutrix sp. TaxID=574032 RepID=UPI0026283A94|nr:hypothetical protein [uncultured Lacinutrix sp.]
MKTITIILFIFFTSIVLSQNDSIALKNINNDSRIDYIFSVDINSFIPSGNLKESLDESLGIGFYFGVPLNQKIRIDLGVSLFFPKTKQNIIYIDNDQILEGGASTSGTLGAWITHMTPIGASLSWEKRFGIGVGFFQTDIETGKPKEENDSVYGVETISFSIGTGIRAKVFRRNIGIKVDYFFTPYNLFKERLPSNFGNSYFTLGLTFGI